MADFGLRAFLTTERSEFLLSSEQPLTVRRGLAHELWLADPAISRDAGGVVQFTLRQDEVWLEPLDPDCVVLLNGERIREPRVIQVGDRIRLGYSILIVHEMTRAEDATDDIRTINLRTEAAKQRQALSAEADRLSQWAESFEAVRAARDDFDLAQIVLPHLARLGESERVLICQAGEGWTEAGLRELAHCGMESGEAFRVAEWCGKQRIEGPSAPLIRDICGGMSTQRAAVGCLIADGVRWMFYIEPPTLASAQAVAQRGLSLLSNLLRLQHTLHGGASQQRLITQLSETVRTYSLPLDEALYERVKERFLFRSGKMQQVCRQLARAAAAATPVLITGERGTGKQVAAEAIHGASARRSKPMVSVSLAESNEELIEAELFGTVKGAFSGAVDKKGLLEYANGTTLFLDEIGEVSLTTQAKLLRVLEYGEFRRVGSPNLTRIDVRLILATNRNLAEEVRRNNFRADLFDRINVIPIRLPPLRERLEDLPVLAAEFLHQSNTQNQKQVRLSPEALQHLGRYAWPENIRGLKYYLERAVVLAEKHDAVLGPDELPPLGSPVEEQTAETNEMSELVEALQKEGKSNQARLLKLLQGTTQRLPKTEFAERLQISRPVLRAELRKLVSFALEAGVDREFFESRVALRPEDWREIESR